MKGQIVNDVHSQLNATRVLGIESPESLEECQDLVLKSGTVCGSGSRHAMGGQQFASGTVLMDMRRLRRVLALDRERGEVEVEAGIEWPELVERLLKAQSEETRPWTIVQKQTGADRLTLGGAVSANIHGRGLKFKPFVQDVESFVLVDADGQARRCSRTENIELFRLAVGGYGLFGLIYSVRLRLMPRRKLRRVVEMMEVEKLVGAMEGRIRQGYWYGDFQFAIDAASPDFLRKGVFSCYEPVSDETPMPSVQHQLTRENWRELLRLAHVDPSRGFRIYAEHYRKSSGQVYWSDLHQFSEYVEDYHREVDRCCGAVVPGSEMITELYVPAEELPGFLAEAGGDLRRAGVPVVYGTVRRIEGDAESFLAWAKRPCYCVIFNLHTEHTAAGIERTAGAFRALIDRAIERDGSFYLTYHRYATREQVEACYPRFGEFMKLKRRYDPRERFQSDWYQHWRRAGF